MPGTPDRAIVFDFDGVLADSEAAHEQALVESAATLGLNVVRNDRPGRYVGVGDVEAFERIAADNRTELTPEQIRTLIGHKGAAFARLAHGGTVRTYPGSTELLHAVHARGIPVAVCSGSRRDDIVPMLEAMGLLPLLATVVSADDVERTKPDPAPYLLTAARLSLPPSKCTAIEDSPAGIAAALAAGFRVHAVCHTFARDRLSGAHHIHAAATDLTLDHLLA
jgi:HAD superfamily hydrolase (TIGR01509 family)